MVHQIINSIKEKANDKNELLLTAVIVAAIIFFSTFSF